MDRMEQRRQERNDEKIVTHGIDATSTDPELTAAMSRLLFSHIEKAKHSKNIGPFVTFYHTKIRETINRMGTMPIACGKGCSHCCYTWVSASAPEILFIARSIKQHQKFLIEKVYAARDAIKDFNFDERTKHAQACPLLNENICSIYPFRPLMCSTAASSDASICERSFRQGANEDIPTPFLYMAVRGAYSVALACAMKRAGFGHILYEFITGLSCALERDDAEEAWLSGENIFVDIMREPSDLFDAEQTNMLYNYIFRE